MCDWASDKSTINITTERNRSALRNAHARTSTADCVMSSNRTTQHNTTKSYPWVQEMYIEELTFLRVIKQRNAALPVPSFSRVTKAPSCRNVQRWNFQNRYTQHHTRWNGKRILYYYYYYYCYYYYNCKWVFTR
jgi:hypothetical protein